MTQPDKTQKRYILLCEKGSRAGETFPLDRPLTHIGRSRSCDIRILDKSISKRHAEVVNEEVRVLIRDLGSRNGIVVDGEKVESAVLRDGAKIEIGHSLLIFKHISESDEGHPLALRRRRHRPLSPGAQFASLALFITVNALLLFFGGRELLRHLKLQEEPPSETESIIRGKSTTQTGRVKPGKPREPEREPDRTPLEFAQKAISSYLWLHQYTQAEAHARECLDSTGQSTARVWLEERLREIQRMGVLFTALLEKLSALDSPLPVDLGPRGKMKIKSASATELTVVKGEGGREYADTLLWDKLMPAHLLVLYKAAGIDAGRELEMGVFCLEFEFLEDAKNYLGKHALREPSSKNEIDELYSRKTGIDIPPDGFPIHDGRLLTPEEFQSVREGEQTEREAQRLAELEAQKKKEFEAEREKFLDAYSRIDDFVRTYRYRTALEEFGRLKSTLGHREFRSRVDQRIAHVERLVALLEKLIAAINSGTLADAVMEFGPDLVGTISKAGDAAFEVALGRKGTMSLEWYTQPPRKMYEFYRRMDLNVDELLLLGVFCLESGLVSEANACLISVLGRAPARKAEVDECLANFYGIEVPEGGFVIHEGALVAVLDKEKFDEGLVKYRGTWVTPEDRARLEAGLVEYDGTWVTPDEHEMLARGYRQYKGKWYTKEELENIRRNWEDAWELDTEHYHVRTNISERLASMMGEVLEQAYVIYKDHFGGEPKIRTNVYVFRNFEDYRTYCISNGNESSLVAGGFASLTNNVAVGWNRTSVETDIISVMLHECAHMFYMKAIGPCAPSWFQEGSAGYFENCAWDGKTLKIEHISKAKLDLAREAFRRGVALSLEELVKTDADASINRGPTQAGLFYSESWALYYFLNHVEDDDIVKGFETLKENLRLGKYAWTVFSGEQSLGAFRDCFGEDLAEVEKKWKGFIQELR